MFYKDPYPAEIFDGVFAKDQFMKGRLKEKTYMYVVNEEDSQFSESHWVMAYQDQKKTYFIDSLRRYFTHYGFKFKRPVYQVSRRLQCLDSKLCGAYLVFFKCRLAKGIDLNSIMGYFTWYCRFDDKFIYDHIKEKL